MNILELFKRLKGKMIEIDQRKKRIEDRKSMLVGMINSLF